MKENYPQNSHEVYMHRCLELARNGLGQVAPNPMVGSVIVHKGKIIGEGYHARFGESHAEVNAIHSVKDKTLLKNSTLYVNLEPCAHTGKTPPCSDLILEKGIPRVVTGTSDPNSVVSGKGIEKLENHGVEVLCNILKDECFMLNRRFFTFHKKKRPYLILKWAQTFDGYIDVIRKPDTPAGVNWISNQLSQSLVHRWRSEEQGIMAGTNTILLDNPKLNVRHWHGTSPIRIILDKSLRVPDSFHVLNNLTYTIVFNNQMNQMHANTEYIKLNDWQNNLSQIMNELYGKEILSVIIEGGKSLIENLMGENLWDEARIFSSEKRFGEGIAAPKMAFPPAFSEKIINDRLMYYKNPDSEFTASLISC